MSFLSKLFGRQPAPAAAQPTPPAQAQPAAESDGPPKQCSPMLMSNLLYAERPRIDPDRLKEALARHLPDSSILTASDNLVMIGHEDLPLPTEDGRGVPAQTNVMLPSDDGRTVPHLEHMLAQTWDWPEAREAVGKARCFAFVAEFLCPHLDLRSRLRVFQGVHRALLEVAPPLAVCSHPAERVINPVALEFPVPPDLDAGLLPLFVNVRLYRITNGSGGDLLLDSRGLAELGLPDVQMHIRGMQANDVANKLYSIAGYLLQHGDCIADGHTVEGFDPSQKWVCRHEDALIGPARVVLDINPGPPHAAGNRK